jgi:hypothetical protein
MDNLREKVEQGAISIQMGPTATAFTSNPMGTTATQASFWLKAIIATRFMVKMMSPGMGDILRTPAPAGR